MVKQCFILSLLLISFCFSVFAGRVLPRDMQLGILKSANSLDLELGPEQSSLLKKIITLGLVNENKQTRMAPTVRIKDLNNRFIVYGGLHHFVDHAVLFKMNQQNQIIELWILTESERKMYRKQLEEKDY